MPRTPTTEAASNVLTGAAESDVARPLADRARPRSLDQVCGQQHVLAEGKPLRVAIDSGHLHSMIFWGPPGCGKTTLARIAALASDAEFIALSAVLGGVADIRKAVDAARQAQSMGKATVLFVDEVHRFNKAQQDAFLPHVESGLITFIGATTENPSFEVNNALLSRVKVYVLKSLTDSELDHLLKSALDRFQPAGVAPVCIDDDAGEVIRAAADGDARRALNLLELAAELAGSDRITRSVAESACQGSLRRFDKGGDAFYDQISALHKSVRSSNPDAALYWFCRMLDGGCDPLYIARRVLRMASEDIGNADPRGLSIALSAWQAYERLGSPEGELAIAQALCFLAAAPKSNAVYSALGAARKAVAGAGTLEVPNHLRNAPTRLSKEMGHGAEYRYDHDEPDGVAYPQHCFPDAMGEPVYYRPVDRGLEASIRERLAYIRQRRGGAGN